MSAELVYEFWMLYVRDSNFIIIVQFDWKQRGTICVCNNWEFFDGKTHIIAASKAIACLQKPRLILRVLWFSRTRLFIPPLLCSDGFSTMGPKFDIVMVEPWKVFETSDFSWCMEKKSYPKFWGEIRISLVFVIRIIWPLSYAKCQKRKR